MIKYTLEFYLFSNSDGGGGINTRRAEEGGREQRRGEGGRGGTYYSHTASNQGVNTRITPANVTAHCAEGLSLLTCTQLL